MCTKFTHLAICAACVAVASTEFHQAVADVPQGLFVDVKSLGPDVNSMEIDAEPYVSPDGSTLYFSSRRSGYFEIYRATRDYESAPFDNVIKLGISNSPHAGPFLSGSKLYFCENRAGHLDLVVATWEGGAFGDATHLEELNTRHAEGNPHVSVDGRRLYFSSSRPEGQGRNDIYVAILNEETGLFDNAVTVGDDLNSPYDDFDPSLSSDELTMFFSDLPPGWGTQRPEGHGDGDIWVATRDEIGDPFGEAVNLNDFSLGSVVNTSYMELSPMISSDWPAIGSKLYFASRQPGNDPPGASGLFEATWIPAVANDFSGDGTVGVADVDLLVGQIVSGSDNKWFDVNRDTVVDNNDLDQWLKDAATQNGFSEPFLPGDANLDGSVTAADLNRLALNWQGSVALWSAGDFMADGLVDAADLNQLALHWLRSIPVADANAAVPEPTALLLTVFGLTLLWPRQRQREA